MSIVSAIALLGSLAAVANAHGTVQGIVAANKYYTGYNPSFQYQSPPPTVIGWSSPEDQDNGYVSDYTSSDIDCHKGATPGGTHAEVAGGDQVTFEWTAWPESHHGPVITYLAKCEADCESVDKTSLKWFKIAESGLIDDSSVPGTWASDKLIANNQSSTVTIPSSIASGNYVARHEIIALHSAGQSGGAQNYPQCINLKVTSSGTDEPAGVVGTSLYTDSDPGILVNIYQSLSTYVIPGPTLYSGASAASATGSASSAALTSSAAAATTSGASSYAAVSSSAPASSTVAATSVATSSVATEAAVVTSSAAASVATAQVTDVVEATTAVTVTGSAPAASSTAVATGSSSTPSKAIPEGTTIEDLLSWVQVLFDEKTSSSNSKTKRAHARDLLRTMRA